MVVGYYDLGVFFPIVNPQCFIDSIICTLMSDT